MIGEPSVGGRFGLLSWGKNVADFNKPFKAVPMKKRLKGLDEFDAPLWSPPEKPEKINWAYVSVGLFIGVCSGLAYVI